ncbi:rhamnan synthesis F family protein [Cyanobium sp. CH-040]|uniref:rhamnan synthesis F family protein n=1 Tax=Cyanobium sp. CH-040 TaxID=2823708 RepID=UPI0020CD2A1C|nr:rhamnan synthesis F family protein [Cyanobium sp. CH-040]MCP9928008.1 glycosyltransferase [Cyanobium sp. CH-040]
MLPDPGVKGQLLRRQLSRALERGDAAAAIAAIEAMVRLRYPPALLRSILGACHPCLDPQFLDPAVVPAPLLLAPALPAALARSPLDARRLALCHGDDLQGFVRNGLNRVLRGEAPLYADLPAVPIEVVRENLWFTPGRRPWLERLSVLECLALEVAPSPPEFPPALRRWSSSPLDAEREPAWVWLELAAPHDSPQQAEAQARLRGMALGFADTRLIKGPADVDALVEDACGQSLAGGARYVLGLGRGELSPCWGDWIRGLALASPGPLLQLVATPGGACPRQPPRPGPEPSLLAIDADWLARRRPDRVARFLEHWQRAAPPSPGRRATAAAAAREWRGTLLLAVTDAQMDQIGEADLRRRAQRCAVRGGFDQGWVLRLERPLQEQLNSRLDGGDGKDVMLAIQGPHDRPQTGAWHHLRRRLTWEPADLTCSDEEFIWGPEADQVGARQLEGPPTPFRVFTRGAVPGLVALPAALVAHLEPAPGYGCVHTLLRDLALQILRRGGRILPLPQVLLQRDPLSNPTVPAFAGPPQRQGLTAAMQREISALSRRHASHWLAPEGAFTPGPRPGTLMVRRLRQPTDRVSVLIPFRDQAALTRRCVESVLRQADGVPLEIVLIDNGSTDPEAIGLAAEFQARSPVPVIGLRDGRPFNFSALNNRARRLCSGTFLLFLNNDIVLESDRVIEQLLDPFGFRGVGAVSARLLYGDGRIQHQGLMAAGGRVHDMLSPGKRMRPGPATAMLTPLEVQEQWSAATGACLLLRADDFDRLGGFDETFTVVHNDVDLCWRLAKRNLAVVVTPEPRILHLESLSRGADVGGENRKRLYGESALLRSRYPGRFGAGDPLHHPLLSPDSRRLEPAAPAARPLHPSRDRLIWNWSRPEAAGSAGRPFLIYAHWDLQGELRPDLLEQLRQYGQRCRVAFVSACPGLAADAQALSRLRPLCEVVLIRENEGHDFGSWKAAIQHCWRQIVEAPRLILTNDSCYGPIHPLDELFDRLDRSRADVVGLTESTLIRPHLQSYFVAYRRRVLRAPIFRAFWQRVGVWADKRQLVRTHEIGWSAMLQRLGYSTEALYMSGYGNISHTHWQELIEEHRFPFLKKELLQANPLGQDISAWPDVVGVFNPVLAAQIRDHQARQRRSPAPG